MKIDILRNILLRSHAADLADEGAVFGRITRGTAFVGLSARVCGSAVGVSCPLVGPVAIDVCAVADAAVDGGAGSAVFAPQTIGGLRVRETVGVDDGEDVDVEFVEDGCVDGVVALVACDDGCCEEFDCHGADPFAGVHGSVPDEGGFGRSGVVAEELDAEDFAVLV